MTRKPPRSRNPIAKAVRTLRAARIPSRKRYTRKPRHKRDLNAYA
jgi:hypothetical protein